MKTLVDTNVLLDIITRDPKWLSWSEVALREAAERSTLAINPIVFAEVSMKFDRIEAADAALVDFVREPLPYEAGFLAGKAFLAYRRRGGEKRSPMPDFYVGAHAVIGRMTLLTRDAARYRTYFPGLKVIAP
ncbi:MAG: type II toxin-antitoxin system VapC family toxin [Myxococcales bacterium]|nr:type II toxin-antitoxin system VapC family toxin [Myxococcales bacterium]